MENVFFVKASFGVVTTFDIEAKAVTYVADGSAAKRYGAAEYDVISRLPVQDKPGFWAWVSSMTGKIFYMSAGASPAG